MTHAELLAAIGRAVGMPGPYEEWRGEREHDHRREVTAGAASGDRVAWIEEVVAPGGSPGMVPIDIDLKIAANGTTLLHLPIESYNPYFGCDCGFLGWFGDRVVAIYREKHRTLAWSVPVDGKDLKLATIGDTYAVDGDLVLFADGDHGLLGALSLPDLETRTPIPTRGDGWWHELQIENGVARASRAAIAAVGTRPALPAVEERVRIPSPKQRWFPRDADAFRIDVERAICEGEAAPPFLSLVVATQAERFWVAHHVASSYEGSHPGRADIRWLPVYWQRHLRGEEASEALALLDRIAADPPETGWDREWDAHEGAVRLAARHVRRRARVLAEVCRTGKLPENEWCSLWRPAKVDLSTHPRAVRAAYETLRATNPVALTST